MSPLTDESSKAPIPGFVKILQDLTQSISISRMINHSGEADIKTSQPSENLSVFGHWMSLILLSGKSLKLTFKTHFMEEALRPIVAKSIGRPSADVTFENVSDFVREFCNLVVGGVEKKLEEQGVKTGISLPLVIRGFDEVFFPPGDGMRTFDHHWYLNIGENHVVCSLGIEVIELATLEKLKPFEENKPEDDGEIEFL